MTRNILVVVAVALLSAAGFGLVLGVAWLVSHLLLGISAEILTARLQAMRGVLPALFAGVAFVGAGCAASVLAARPRIRRSQSALPPELPPKLPPELPPTLHV